MGTWTDGRVLHASLPSLPEGNIQQPGGWVGVGESWAGDWPLVKSLGEAAGLGEQVRTLRRFGGEGAILSPSPTSPLPASKGDALPPTLGDSGVQNALRPGVLVFQN